jgi:hypothetical protein
MAGFTALDGLPTVGYPERRSAYALGPNTMIATGALESLASVAEGTLQGFHL